ncbi:MAG: right-handed parallel beta-helix repeat-containing protein [Anaerolineae bacterium]
MHKLAPRLILCITILGMFVGSPGPVRADLASTPVTFIVTSTGDEPDSNPGDRVCRTASNYCSLRAALQETNALPADTDVTVRFGIGAADGQPRVIFAASALPTILHRLQIVGPNLVGGVPGRVVLSGQNLAVNQAVQQHGLAVAASYVAVTNIEVVDFPGNGIHIANASYITITGSYIGKGRGTAGAGRGNVNGIRLENTQFARIGGPEPGDRNVIAGNTWCAVTLSPGDDAVIERNYLGVLADGLTAEVNRCGVLVDGGSRNLVKGNLISAWLEGIQVRANSITSTIRATATTIQGNWIGLDATGSAELPGWFGVYLRSGCDDTLIGGDAADERNVISGIEEGIVLELGDIRRTTISGNYIGLNSAGTAALPNGNWGILIAGGSDTVIGGDTPAERNVISGNQYGIKLLGAGTAGVRIIGNYIGTNAAGNTAVPNRDNGINVDDAAGTIIGGSTSALRNVISGNSGSGIIVAGSQVSATVISGNYIGTSASGLAAVPNGTGIVLAGGHDTIIGGSTPGEGNIIAGNTGSGIVSTSMGNTISANRIGLGVSNASLGNGGDGIYASYPLMRIGRAVDTADDTGGNIIAYNRGSGINLSYSALAPMYGNSIYANGKLGIDYGNDGPTLNQQVGSGPYLDPAPTNYPLLDSVVITGTTAVILGHLVSASSSTVTLDFYVSQAPDASGYGEGQTWLGSLVVVTDADGLADFSFSADSPAARYGYFTATGTSAANGTGEFSPTFKVVPNEVWLPIAFSQ